MQTLRIMGVSIKSAVKALATMTWIAPSLFIQKRRAFSIFQRQLRGYGLNEQAIRELTRSYQKIGELKSLLEQLNVK